MIRLIRAVPAHIHEAPADVQRAWRLTWVLARIEVALALYMLADRLIFPFPAEFEQFNRLGLWAIWLWVVLGAGATIAVLAKRMALAQWLVLIFAAGLSSAMTLFLGRISGIDVIAPLVLIFLPYVLFHDHQLAARRGGIALALAAILGLQTYLWVNPDPLFPVDMMLLYTVRYGVIGFGLIVGLFVAYLHRTAESAKSALAAERDRSEALLLNILPATIAERLKAGEQVIADGAPAVTVLFADIVGFTGFAEGRSPEGLVSVLNDIFVRFDAAAAAQGVEKIKTIGDGYLAVAGLPIPLPDHADRAVKAALAMIRAVDTVNQSSGTALAVRIGLHSGPVVAGVIGRHKFAYDLWGDTVNTAARFETAGAPGRICLSAATRAALRGPVELEARGEIPLKGKDPAEAWFVR